MDYGLGGYGSINAFVESKLRRFSQRERSFRTMFDLMFSESENVMYERSEGYRIKKTTYGQAKDDIIRMTSSLSERAAGLPRGSVVGLYMENSLLFIECLWAILAAGYRPLLFNMRLSDEVLKEAIRSAECRAVVSRQKDFGLPRIDPDSLGDGEKNDLSSPFGEEILVMSSGTTSHVKVCAYTGSEFYHQIHDSFNIIKKCRQVKKHCDGSLKLLAFLPFYHVFGLIAVYIWFAFFSRTFVHLPDMAPETIVNTIRRHKVTHIFAVPLFWETVHATALKTIERRGEKTRAKFERAMKLYDRLPDGAARAFSRVAFREVRDNLFGGSIRFMITGGSFIPPETMRFFNGIGYRLANGYGMTEIGITSFEISPKKKYLLGCFVGSPMTYAEYSINEDGELLVRGKVIASYVIENGVKTSPDGWFNTHDLAEEEDGHFRILGRRDDLIVSGDGENVNPNLVEPLLCPAGCGGVCLVPGGPADGAAPVLLVFVNKFISREKLTSVSDETKELVARAGMTGRIRKIAFIAGPIMTADEFKINRRRLADEYARGVLCEVTPESVADEGERDALLSEVISHFAAAVGKDGGDVAPDADFFLDCGGSSLEYFAMISALRETFGIPFPTEGEKGLNTPRGVADFIKRNGGV